jgi:outer membrane immunogenic protein
MRERSAMKKVLLASVAALLLSDSAPAWSADFPIHVRPPVLIPAFTWSSCYLGAQLGYGWSHKEVTDPAELVQDSINQFLDLGLPLTPTVTTVGLSPKGYILGGQFGCDHQFAGSNWVIGFEGSVTGGNLKAETIFGLPLDPDIPGNPARLTARTDFLPSGTVRLGYAWDRWLLYAKAGAAGASDRYSIVGVFSPITTPTPFNFQGVDLRIGWTAGGGIEWAFCEDWSVKVEYDYHNFGHKTVLMTDSINFNPALSGPVDVTQSVQTIKVGLNFHVWSTW